MVSRSQNPFILRWLHREHSETASRRGLGLFHSTQRVSRGRWWWAQMGPEWDTDLWQHHVPPRHVNEMGALEPTSCCKSSLVCSHSTWWFFPTITFIAFLILLLKLYTGCAGSQELLYYHNVCNKDCFPMNDQQKQTLPDALLMESL